MDPYGRPIHTHHRRNDLEEEERRPPFYPPPPVVAAHHAPPPPPHHVHHAGDHHGFSSLHHHHSPPPPPEVVAAVAAAEVRHEIHHRQEELRKAEASHHSLKPHAPSFHHSHHSKAAAELSTKPTVRVYSKAEPNFSLTIRNHTVILAPSNTADLYQHWYKDEKFSTRVKDEEGFPSFALVNKATGLAMKHSVGDTKPVQLIPYNPDVLDESILWTESKDLGDGYRTIRMVNNIRLNVDAFNGDKNHGGVRDGTTIVLWQWKKGDNQRWKILPYSGYV